MHIAISLLLVVLFLIMNAFFVIAEFALVRVRRSQLEMAVEEGKKGAKKAKKIADNINDYLSACQLGITLASLALGWLGEPALSELIRPLFELIGLPQAAISAIAVAIGYFLMTALHVVAGELIPKSFAIFATEKWALKTAGVLDAFYKITYPVMILFNGITGGVVKLFGHDPANEHDVYTGDEIKLLIDESTESGLIDPDQNKFVDNIFDLRDKDAEAIMTPRTDVIYLDLDDPLEDNLKIISKYKFTRYPVCRGSKDSIVGFVHVKDLYTMTHDSTIDELKIRTIQAVPGSISIAKLLRVLQEKHTKIAVVVDEYGGTAGIVTMSDIFGEIIGRTDDEYFHDMVDKIEEQPDGTYRIEGSLPIDDLCEFMGFTPQEAKECETAGGLLLSLFDRIPEVGDVTSVEGSDKMVTFKVTKMAHNRIDSISFSIQQVYDESDEVQDSDD